MDIREHTGHRERLREWMEREGLRGFAPHEVLELLLTYAIPRGDVNPLAHRLLKHFGSLPAVLEASPAELCQVSGVGPRAATLLSMLLPVFQRYQMEKMMPKQQIENYSQLSSYCSALFLGENTEKFYVICLDSRLNMISAECINAGTSMEVSVAPRLVVREAIRRNAAGVTVTHNHPSGTATPSQEDIDVTERIRKALYSVDIRLYDHLIVAGSSIFSFQRYGLLAEAGSGFVPFPDAQNGEMAAERPQRKMPPQKKK